ncbi:MAG: B12-binding domain-containing radical SAM protein [Candidatus Omnitrophica bacterium]|nr:B12-binding domain-containing radical SAM protein [Candidatus Omnitrophota bacterium]
MNVAAVLMPWYRRESPAPEFALMIALLKRAGHTVSVYDVNNDLFHNEFFLRTYWKYFLLDAPSDIEEEFFAKNREMFEHFASHILSSRPQVVIFKMAGKTIANSTEIARVIKEKSRETTVIFSGALVPSRENVESFVSAQDNLPFDYIICGEDEVALPVLLAGLDSGSFGALRQRGKVIDCLDGPIVDNLDDLPYYDFSCFDLRRYKIPERLEFFISKGCPWRCAFCGDWLTERKYRSMSAERIFREVEYQVALHRTKYIRFCDKTINGDIGAIEGFCDLVLKHYGYVDLFSWSGDAMIRPEMTIGLLQKMFHAGCRGIGYGLESGSDKVIRDMRKAFSITLAEEVIKNTHICGITTSVNIMTGFPTETERDFQDTISFIERNRAFIDEIRLTFLGCRILKHSTLYEFPEKFNLASLDKDYWSTKDGLNTYEERIRRYEAVCQRVLDLGIELRVNSRITKKVEKAS